MSLPDLNPKKTLSGITVDPRTLERVIPESKRADGTVRKQLKVRPGFTPQEDVSRFRGSRQQQMDRSALPKGHILGWVAPSAETKKVNVGGGTRPGAPAVSSTTGEPLSKSAAKNAKRRAKKREQEQEADKDKNDPVKENWDDSDGEKEKGEKASEKDPSVATKKEEAQAQNADGLAEGMQKLDLR